jgi:hypothetical protein
VLSAVVIDTMVWNRETEKPVVRREGEGRGDTQGKYTLSPPILR